MAEEGGEHNKDHGIGNPGEVLEWHIALKLPMYPLIGCKMENHRNKKSLEERNGALHTGF